MQATISKQERVYDGFFKVERCQIEVERFDGGSLSIARERVIRGPAAAVLIHDTERDVWLLVEQFRPGAMAGKASPWLLELVAGMIDPGERPEDVVRREAQEEANVVLQTVEPLCDYWDQ